MDMYDSWSIHYKIIYFTTFLNCMATYVGRSNFVRVCINLTTLIKKTTYFNENCCIIYVFIYKTLNETAKGNFKNTLIQ